MKMVSVELWRFTWPNKSKKWWQWCEPSFHLLKDEESTIEEQEVMEGETDHKAELVDLAKDGMYLLFFYNSGEIFKKEYWV